MKYSRKSKTGRKLSKTEKKEVKRMISTPVEVKYYNKLTGATTVNFSGSLYLLSDIPQGITDGDRDGDQCHLSSINVRAEWNVGSNLTIFNLVRFIVFQWHPQTTPTIGQILTGTGAAIAPLNPYTRDTRSMFRILYDKTGVVSNANGAASIHYKLTLTKRFNRKLQYQGGTTVGSNQIYILVISDGTTPYPQFSWYSQLLYSDS